MAAKVNAEQVYVGVTIVHAGIYGQPSGTNWCLPGGYQNLGTQMVITKDSFCSASNSNQTASSVCGSCSGYCYGSSPDQVTYTAFPTCPGGTIWSRLIDITNGDHYKVYLYTPTFCPGYIDELGACWVSDKPNEDCNAVCSNYGLTSSGNGTDSCLSDTADDDSNCSIEASLMGSACSGGCNTGASYSDYNPSTKVCNTTHPSYFYSISCSYSDPNFANVCSCNIPAAGDNGTGFILPTSASSPDYFTASF